MRDRLLTGHRVLIEHKSILNRERERERERELEKSFVIEMINHVGLVGYCSKIPKSNGETG